MAERSVVHGRSNRAALLQGEGISNETIEALIGSGFGSSSMVRFEDVCGNASKKPFFHQHPFELEEAIEEDEPEESGFHRQEKKRRLTAHQVQFLEKSFELENKLEPEKKIQLAKDLGLQPRQVAIWFQNRRARWKTKQMEKDFTSLKSRYESLMADYDALTEEKERLKSEVQKLSDELRLKEKENKKNTGYQEEENSPDGNKTYSGDGPARSDNSDISNVEECEVVKTHNSIFKLEDDDDDDNSFGFRAEDQPMWFWTF